MNMKWMYSSLIGGLLTIIPASAQAGSFEDRIVALVRKVGVHGNMSFRRPTDTDVTDGLAFGPSIGLSPGLTNGWKYPASLSFLSEDVHTPSGAEFGTVKARALMAGIGYGWHFGQWSVGPQRKLGYSFNHSTVDDGAGAAVGTPGAVSMDVGDAWLVRPEFKAEYFITQKLTFRTSVDYTYMKPDVVVTVPTGVVNNQWDMSSVHANIGIGFYPFRK